MTPRSPAPTWPRSDGPFGAAHGFALGIPAGPGQHSICPYAINQGVGANRPFGCQTVGVPAAPFGNLDAVMPTAGGLLVSGWAIDAQTSAPVEIHVYVDGGFAGWGYATATRTDVAAAYPWFGPTRGYAIGAAATAGSHSVCVYAINVGAGATTGLGCRTVVR